MLSSNLAQLTEFVAYLLAYIRMQCKRPFFFFFETDNMLISKGVNLPAEQSNTLTSAVTFIEESGELNKQSVQTFRG